MGKPAVAAARLLNTLPVDGVVFRFPVCRGDKIRWLDDFMLGLSTGSRVLELGCGNGRDAEVLLAHGFDVDATDGSPGMVAEAKRRIGSAVRLMRFDELSSITAYDGIWANASLLHLPTGKLAHVLSLILQALKANGLHFATFKSGAVAGRDTLGRYYNSLDRDKLAAAYAKSGSKFLLIF